jgi:menaquinone-dependent protoporphyrinogen oxidase
MKVLVTAASRYGATAEIAQAIGDVLCERGLDAVIIPPENVGNVEDYDAVVLGSAVYSGRWLEPAKRLVDRSCGALATRPVWLFSSGPVGDPSRKLVQKMGQDPVDLAETLQGTRARDHRMFAGKLERRHLSFPQKAALTLFRGLEGDFRDWTEIRQWASAIASELRAPLASA